MIFFLYILFTGMYFFLLVLIGCCSISGTVGVLHLWHKNTVNHPFPSYLRYLISSPIIRFIGNFEDRCYIDASNTQDGKDDLKMNTHLENIYIISGRRSIDSNDSKQVVGSTLSCDASIGNGDTRAGVGNSSSMLKDDVVFTNTLSDWQKIALIADRLLFITLSAITFIILSSICLIFLLEHD